MVCRLIACLFAAGVGSLTFVATADSEPVYPPGSRVGLEVPGDLKPSTRIPGFEDTERKVSISILDLPASAYFELETAAFTKLRKTSSKQSGKAFRSIAALAF